MGEIAHGATAGFAVALACFGKTRRKRRDKMDGTGSAMNPEFNVHFGVENRRRNCGMGWSFANSNGIVLACLGEERVRKKG